MVSLELPLKIKEKVKNLNYTIDAIGCSDDSVLIFDDKYILKISDDVKRLEDEMLKNDWLYGKIPSSKNILFWEVLSHIPNFKGVKVNPV